ncbi:hypothetical protein [Halopenitus sp. POP-27]|uniref:hypothetical protein n=1 Tax=Halopenitus sp. POP-27 TaxID=2994425 RepID=UPI002468E18D|nr:hypothetical protein [Halopenitus sp. POP-27]
MCPATHTDDTHDDGTVHDRLERYFVVSALRCRDCGDLHEQVRVGGETYTAADFAIDSLAEWRLEMDKEESWIRSHRSAVREALPDLADDWPETAAAVRDRLLAE